MKQRFAEITEQPGQKATREQLERLCQRYRFASRFTNGGEVLEVGCGSGIGLGLLSRYASGVVGGDIDKRNIEIALEQYRNNKNVTISQMDAHELPFEKCSFDTVILFEAIYYLEKPEQFISEAHRVLKDTGKLVISTVNKDWKDFHPSEYSINYYSVPELHALAVKRFGHVETFGGFPVLSEGRRARAYSLLKRLASKLNLIPGSLRSREMLKRIFIGKLATIPPDISSIGIQFEDPVMIPNNRCTDGYKVIYCVARELPVKETAKPG